MNVSSTITHFSRVGVVGEIVKGISVFSMIRSNERNFFSCEERKKIFSSF